MMLEYIWACLQRRRRYDSKVFRSVSKNQTRGADRCVESRLISTGKRREAEELQLGKGKKRKEKRFADGALPKAE